MPNALKKQQAPEDSSHRSLKHRLAHSGRRWMWLLAVAVLGAVAFEMLLAFSWGYVRQLQLPYSPPFEALTAWLTVLLLVYLVGEPIRIGKRQWPRMLWYPPVWLAVPLAWGLAAAAERLPVAFRPQSSGPDWEHFYPIVPIVLAVTLALGLRQPPWRKMVRSTSQPNTRDDSGLTWREVEAWILQGERPITSGDRDLFQHRRIAARIARSVAVDQRQVALLGRFGTGKSSILNLVVAELALSREPLIVADFDVWAVPKPEDVPRLALNHILTALDDYVDTIEFRTLPIAYQRLAAAEPTGWLSKVLGLESTGDSIELLEPLTKVLATIGARVVVIVQDLERAGGGFDTRHLQRLLWALRNASGIHFILSIDPTHALLDFAKLCDSIELVPAMEVDQVARLLNIAYGHWRTKFADLDPHPKRRDGDKLQLGQAFAGRMADYIRRTGQDTPLDALVALLDTPRALKHLLGQVDRAWNNLHGEVELDDIVIVSALRYGAEPVYRFLLTYIDAARHKPDDMFPRTKAVKDEWTRVLAQLPNGPAAERLVGLMGIKQLAKEIVFGENSPQDVRVSEPVDYFRRIVSGELSATELRDQVVLRDIDEWKATRTGPLLGQLLTSSEDDEEYVRVWEHFSGRHTDAELMELVDRLVARVKERDGSAAAADHRGLIGLWRQCNRRLRRNQHVEWLRVLILNALPASLYLGTGLFYYWTGQYGIVDDAGRADIRQSIIKTVRATIRTGDDLARVLTSKVPYLIGRLITQTGADPSLAAFEAWSDHLPALIIEGAKKHPEVLAPELANLAGDEESGVVAAGGEYPPIFINRYAIERARMTALFGDRLDEALALLADYTGDNPYAARAKGAARAMLDERRDGARPPAEQAPAPSKQSQPS